MLCFIENIIDCLILILSLRAPQTAIYQITTRLRGVVDTQFQISIAKGNLYRLRVESVQELQ